MSAQPIITPCVKVCMVDGASSHCLGCGRTLQEITGWTKMTDAGREEVMAALPARLAELERQGRA